MVNAVFVFAGRQLDISFNCQVELFGQIYNQKPKQVLHWLTTSICLKNQEICSTVFSSSTMGMFRPSANSRNFQPGRANVRRFKTLLMVRIVQHNNLSFYSLLSSGVDGFRRPLGDVEGARTWHNRLAAVLSLSSGMRSPSCLVVGASSRTASACRSEFRHNGVGRSVLLL